MKGFGVLEDGTTFPLTLVEISYRGCKIKTDIALFPGVEIRISTIGGRSAVQGRVRWHKDGRAGVEFVSEEVQPAPETPRLHSRVTLNASVSLRRIGGHACRTALFDLTPAGCKVEFLHRPRVGDRLWAKFEGIEAVEATVAWVDGFQGGLKFIRPLHPAIFDWLVARLNS